MPNSKYIPGVESIDRVHKLEMPVVSLPLIKLLVILDRSGSMADWKGPVLSAWEKYRSSVSKHRARYLVTVTQFADELEVLVRSEPLDKVSVEYNPGKGGTALFDSLGQALLLERVRQPHHVYVLIATDGENTVSGEMTQQQIWGMIQARRESGNWTFLWLSLDGKPSRAARALGVECLDVPKDQIDKAFVAAATRLGREAVRIAASQLKQLPPGGLDGF
jgi:hypothetical protein